MKLRHLFAFFAVVALLLGCGGGSGGGSGSGSGSIEVFATDNPRDDYSKIWLTIHKVELVSGAEATTVFDDPTGRLVDIRSLRDASGERFLFLGNSSLGLKPYDAARVTVAKQLSAVPTGSTTTQSLTMHADFDAGSGRSAMTFSLANGGSIGASERQFVVDFDLSQWTVEGAIVRPLARRSSGNGIGNIARHEHEDYHGTISQLSGTAPNLTFVLTAANGGRFSVETSASTQIFFSNGGASPALANGQFVEARGSFSTSNNALVATSVKIEDGSGGNIGEPEIKGPYSAIDAVAGTFKVEARWVNFVPAQTDVNIVTTASTTYRGESGATVTKEQFFALLVAGAQPFVEVEGGTYNSTTNTLTARKMKFEDDLGAGGGGGGVGNNAEVNGIVSNLNAGAGTFSVTLGAWFGFNGTPGMIIPVQTTASTTYRNDEGNSITAQQFFAALANGQLVEAEGHYNGTALVASKCKLDDD